VADYNRALMSAAVEAYERIRPIFEDTLSETPNDPEAAFDRALQIARAGVLSGPGWRLFSQQFFQGDVRPLAFGMHGIIPPMSSLPPDFRITPTPDRLQ
jgi:hypothetical protein